MSSAADDAAARLESGYNEAKFFHEQMIEDAALRRFFETHFVPVSLAGRIPVKVDASYGSIAIGDLLTTSATPGHAMRADTPVPGTVIGKALEPLDRGTGVIKVLVMLR